MVEAQLETPVITLLPGMQIDFGGIGKEYAVDQAIQLVAQLSGAAVLVNFGGDLAVTRAREGDRPWRVGIEGIDPATGAEPNAGAPHSISRQARWLPAATPTDSWNRKVYDCLIFSIRATGIR
jgi:thiamine biosynthesis lipoprotein ApbE